MQSVESNSLTFPVKLKKIVDAPETDHLIYWDEDGTSFHISDENKFAREVIPNYFKHCNISSFIRQLNMYGFHKINRIENGLYLSGQEDSHWKHPYFLRDFPDLLQNIIRKVPTGPLALNTNTKSSEYSLKAALENIDKLVKAVEYLKKKDENTQKKLKAVEELSNQLYSEMIYFREMHEKQSKLIQLLVDFFSLYTNKSGISSRLKPKRSLLALDKPPDINTSDDEPPKKYFVTSPADSTDSSYKPVGTTIISSQSNKIQRPKKIIKITNISDNPQRIEVNVPRTNNNLTISPSPTLQSINNQNSPGVNSPKVMYTFSIPKSSASVSSFGSVHSISTASASPKIIRPIKAISGPTNITASSKINSTPISRLALTQARPVDPTLNVQKAIKYTPVSTMLNNISSNNNINKVNVAKPVGLFNQSFSNTGELLGTSDMKAVDGPINVNNDSVDASSSLDDTTIDFDIEDLLNINTSELDALSNNAKQSNQSSTLLSEISQSVCTVGQGLNSLKRMLTIDNLSDYSGCNNKFLQSQVNHVLPEEIKPVTGAQLVDYTTPVVSECSNWPLVSGGDGDLENDHLRNLWESINNEDLNDDFETHSFEEIANVDTPNIQKDDNFSLDDFLQTPNIEPEIPSSHIQFSSLNPKVISTSQGSSSNLGLSNKINRR